VCRIDATGRLEGVVLPTVSLHGLSPEAKGTTEHSIFRFRPGAPAPLKTGIRLELRINPMPC
jgi:hypothetical protein